MAVVTQGLGCVVFILLQAATGREDIGSKGCVSVGTISGSVVWGYAKITSTSFHFIDPSLTAKLEACPSGQSSRISETGGVFSSAICVVPGVGGLPRTISLIMIAPWNLESKLPLHLESGDQGVPPG